MNRYLHTPVEPFPVAEGAGAAELLAQMAATSFQGRNLGQALQIWKRMLEEETTIFFGLAGALVPAGMRRIMAYLIEQRFIDVLVSTGANLFHDLYETLGYHHYQGSAAPDDGELAKAEINRIYDTYASEDDIVRTEEFIATFASSLERDRPYTSRQFFYLLGRKLLAEGKREGILTAAAESGVPIYCPALADSAYGIALAAGRQAGSSRVIFDVIGDVVETTRIAVTAAATGVIYVGGGTPKNFIQQTEVADYIFDKELPGHRYAIQVTTDSPSFGGLSGCTFAEAVSWGKVAPQAETVTVNCDATIALPLLTSALAESCPELAQTRPKPHFAALGDPRGLDIA